MYKDLESDFYDIDNDLNSVIKKRYTVQKNTNDGIYSDEGN